MKKKYQSPKMALLATEPMQLMTGSKPTAISFHVDHTQSDDNEDITTGTTTTDWNKVYNYGTDKDGQYDASDSDNW